VEFTVLDNGYGLATIYSFFDNTLLTIQLWERMIQMLNDNEIPGLIIDMRQNGGGSGFLADQMAAYSFDEELTLGNTGFYDPDSADFFFDPRSEGVFYLPRRVFATAARSPCWSGRTAPVRANSSRTT